MAPRENNRAAATEPNGDLLRWATYIAVGAVLLVSLWALSKGNDRDLWTASSAIVVTVGLTSAT